MATGQTLNDRLNAARYAIAGQGLARVVCKATTEEIIGPKKKHLDYLLHCTQEPNVSIPQMANLLIERTSHNSWVVVFKALVTVHHLMCYGNERFTQYLASSNCNFQLSNFLDKAGAKAYDMSTYIRRYSKYINEKALSYRTLAFDFAKMKRGKEDGSLRQMPTDKLLKTIPTLQNQIDSLLEFDCNANDLTNGVINAAFMLLFRDLIRLFACYNDGIINLLEKFFDMNKKQCREALDIYKKFLIRMDRVAEFLKVAENVGIDKGEIPDLTKAPSSLLEALEQHLQALEGNKKTVKGKENHSPGQTPAPAHNAATNGTGAPPNELEHIKDEHVKKALEEEAQILSQLKFNILPAKPPKATESSSIFEWKQETWPNLERHEQDKPYNPFLSSPTGETVVSSTGSAVTSNSVDLFDLFGTSNADNQSAKNASNKASDDLMMLANNSSSAVAASASAAAAAPQISQNPFADILSGLSVTGTNSMSNNVSSTFNGSSPFSANFDNAFGNQISTNTSQGFDAFGDLLQPQKSEISTMPPQPAAPVVSTGGIIKGDLDSSLASLAQNLDINTPKGVFKKPGQQFNPPKTTMMTGGANKAGMNWSNMTVTPSVPVGMMQNQWGSMQPTMGAPMGQAYGVSMNMGMLNNQNAMPGMMAPIMSTGMMGATNPPVSNIFTGSSTSMNNNFPTSTNSFSSDPFGAL